MVRKCVPVVLEILNPAINLTVQSIPENRLFSRFWLGKAQMSMYWWCTLVRLFTHLG